MMKRILLVCCLLAGMTAAAQYAPQAGVAGSDAIAAASSRFVAWATDCRVQRGLKQIGDTTQGYAEAGDSSLALGMADATIVSLGDSGIATLTFAKPITNGPGADFAVFENGFANGANPEEAFLELGFVEVSSDGVHFFRFPAASLIQDTNQLSSVVNLNYVNARLLNNLAGKYISGYGTPFDLQELAGTTGLDVNRITHVRVIDVIGSINGHTCYDASGHKINDPFPTNFPTGGFDLDAVGVINQLNTSGIATTNQSLALNVYPNPATEQVTVQWAATPGGTLTLQLTDATGRLMDRRMLQAGETAIPLQALPAGIYYLTARDEKGNQWAGKVYRQ